MGGTHRRRKGFKGAGTGRDEQVRGKGNGGGGKGQIGRVGESWPRAYRKGRSEIKRIVTTKMTHERRVRWKEKDCPKRIDTVQARECGSIKKSEGNRRKKLSRTSNKERKVRRLDRKKRKWTTRDAEDQPQGGKPFTRGPREKRLKLSPLNQGSES